MRLVEKLHRIHRHRLPSCFYYTAHHVDHPNLVVIGLCRTYSISRAIVLFERKCMEEMVQQKGSAS